MKKYFTALLLTAALGTGAAQAATLAELNGPLLGKDQWELNALTDIGYYKESFRQKNDDGTAEKAKYDYTQASLRPDVTYGLTDKLSLMVQESYLVPYNFRVNDYNIPAGGGTYYKNSYLVRNTLTSALTWRPSEPWEFYFSGSRGYANRGSQTGDLPKGSGDFGSQGAHAYNTTLTAQATWLSNPKAGAKTANNRADLDGLLNPLLDRGQFKTSLILNYYADYTRAHRYDAASGGTHFTANRSYSQELLASPSLQYGLRDNLQLQASADLTIPNASYDSSRNHIVQNLTTLQYSMSKSRALAGYVPSLRITNRINNRLQCYATGSYSYQKTSERSLPTSGAASSTVYGRETASIGIGADWVSRPQKDGRQLAADLDGLKKPLLEKRQYRISASYTTGKQRDWTQGGASEAGLNTNLYYSEFAYGLTDALQGFASLELTPGYSTWDSATRKITYFPVSSYGAGLTWRPRQTFQAYAAATLTPSYEKAKNYSGSGGYTAKNRTIAAAATLSATWLW